MDRKKILVDIYLAQNLGDDLFLDHLSHSFPDIDFVPFHPGKDYHLFFKNYNNILSFPYSFFDKIKARVGHSKLSDYSALSQQYDGLLFLGGGIFREESYWNELYDYRSQIIDAFKKQQKQVFFSGCNFGPFHTDVFLIAYDKLFQKVDQIIFRDRKSYELFSNLQNTSYAPDLLWSFDLPPVVQQEKTIGISVINPRHKEQYQDTYRDYVEGHRNLCRYYLQKDYKVILFSFCEKEGDLAIAQDIALNFPEIEIQNYTTDISSYLKKLGTCSHFVAARFHAVIIAFKYGIPVLPVIYGDKTENLLEDLGFIKPFVYVDTIDELMAAKFLTLSTKQQDGLYNDSKTHFDIKF